MNKVRRFILGGSLIASTAFAGVKDVSLDQKIGHEIRSYARYSIWDNINVAVDGSNVRLTGQVSQPFKKSDIQRIVVATPGVTAVKNDLTVLPLSPFDDRLRLQVARAIYADPVLSRYGAPVVPSIHVIVDNGRVTLEGVVDNETDRNVAALRANAAGLSFGNVTNNLRVAPNSAL
jgi:hyperosmotically inducible protein